MSFIRHRKIYIIKAGIIGSIITAIPLILIILYFLYKSYVNTIDLENINYIKCWELNKDLEVYDTITENDLTKIEISSEIAPKCILQKKDIIGKKIKLSLSEKTIVTDDLLTDEVNISDDLRIQKYNCIKITERLKAGSFVDIRIFFANGTDFVVLSKKEVVDCSLYNMEKNQDNTLWLKVTEEELLRLSSAIVDASINDGCYIYAIEYVEDTQDNANITYPVNEEVEKLINNNPNIIENAENNLSSNLRKKFNIRDVIDTNNENDIQSDNNTSELLGKNYNNYLNEYFYEKNDNYYQSENEDIKYID